MVELEISLGLKRQSFGYMSGIVSRNKSRIRSGMKNVKDRILEWQKFTINGQVVIQVRNQVWVQVRNHVWFQVWPKRNLIDEQVLQASIVE